MQPWIIRSARRKSAESNTRNAIACIEEARITGGSKSCNTNSYLEALASLRLAVRDLEVAEGQRDR